jgi:hypothetical protein
MFLLCLKHFSNGCLMPHRLEERSKVLLPAQFVRRGLAEAVIGENPAAGKKFRAAHRRMLFGQFARNSPNSRSPACSL